MKTTIALVVILALVQANVQETNKFKSPEFVKSMFEAGVKDYVNEEAFVPKFYKRSAHMFKFDYTMWSEGEHTYEFCASFRDESGSRYHGFFWVRYYEKTNTTYVKASSHLPYYQEKDLPEEKLVAKALINDYYPDFDNKLAEIGANLTLIIGLRVDLKSYKMLCYELFAVVSNR